MSDTSPVRYDLHLSLMGLPAGGAEEVKECLEAALASACTEGSVVVLSVTERPAAIAGSP